MDRLRKTKTYCIRKIMKEKRPDTGEKTYEVSPLGSLGLLATGYKGVKAWREARKKAMKRIQNGGADEQKKD